MKLRIIIFSMAMLVILSLIGIIFWEQELKYALPTPVPSNFINTELGQTIDLSPFLEVKEGRKTLMHFYSEACPCSRFNMKEFERLAKRYEEEVDFFIVVQSSDSNAANNFQKKYELELPVIADLDGKISDLCGIYATPQAVILDENSQLYFKGNYNKARFCTRKETRYVDAALKNLIAGNPLPLDVQMALSQPYGCTLPSDDEFHLGQEASLINIFN